MPGGPAEHHLRRAVGLRGLTMISLGSIIGSGWLLGALTAAKVAGAASLISWILAGLVLALLALVHAELGSTYPVSGGTARFPFMVFGALGGFTGGWMAWIQAVTIAPIEVEATLGYLNSKYIHLALLNGNGTLTAKGIGIGALFMLVFTIINIMGVCWLAESNTIATYWKILIPTITIFALLFSVFHTSNFSASGGFAPYGFHGVFAALLWAAPIKGVGAFGPYATLATNAGIGWLATLLVIDAVVSPAGTGLIYIGTSSRLAYGLGRNDYFPRVISKVSARGVPLISICICFVVGMLAFLPFPSWAGLVGLVTSATVIMYAMAPVSLAGLRRKDPDRPRAYRLPAAGVLCPVAFICANFIVYFAGFSTIFWLYVFVAVGFVIFAGYQAALPPPRRTIIEWRSAYWIVPWLAALIIVSWLGNYDGVPPTVFGVTLLAIHHLGQWVDLAVLAAVSLAIYYWAVHSGMSAAKVRAAVESVEAEASAELETPLA